MRALTMHEGGRIRSYLIEILRFTNFKLSFIL